MLPIRISRWGPLRAKSGKEFVGCSVENAAYPQVPAAEAGAIAAMVAAGETGIDEIWVVANSSETVAPAEAAGRNSPSSLPRKPWSYPEWRVNGKTDPGWLLPDSFSGEHLPT